MFHYWRGGVENAMKRMMRNIKGFKKKYNKSSYRWNEMRWTSRTWEIWWEESLQMTRTENRTTHGDYEGKKLFKFYASEFCRISTELCSLNLFTENELFKWSITKNCFFSIQPCFCDISHCNFVKIYWKKNYWCTLFNWNNHKGH